MSYDARGRFGFGMIFKRGGIVTRYFQPRNPNTAAQQAQRAFMKEYWMGALTKAVADLLYSALGHLHDDRYLQSVPQQDHGGLAGLGDDDHSHYFNRTRADARYSLLTHLHDSRYLQDAPNNTNYYGRKGLAWAVVPVRVFDVKYLTASAALSGTTLTSISGLEFTIPEAASMFCSGCVYYAAPAAADFKYAITATESLIYSWRWHIVPGGTAFVVGQDQGSGATVQMLSASANYGYFEWRSYIVNTGMPGVFQVKGAQVTSNATPVYVLPGSYVEYIRAN